MTPTEKTLFNSTVAETIKSSVFFTDVMKAYDLTEAEALALAKGCIAAVAAITGSGLDRTNQQSACGGAAVALSASLDIPAEKAQAIAQTLMHQVLDIRGKEEEPVTERDCPACQEYYTENPTNG